MTDEERALLHSYNVLRMSGGPYMACCQSRVGDKERYGVRNAETDLETGSQAITSLRYMRHGG